jgi:hypothetical protein
MFAIESNNSAVSPLATDAPSVAPEVLEPLWRHFGVADGVLNASVTEVVGAMFVVTSAEMSARLTLCPPHRRVSLKFFSILSKRTHKS